MNNFEFTFVSGCIEAYGASNLAMISVMSCNRIALDCASLEKHTIK